MTIKDSIQAMELLEIEPEYDPQAITNYYAIGELAGRSKETNVKLLILKAKKHLCAIGWSFFYIYKNPNHRELRYRSPNGKTYISLRKACFGLIEHQAQIISDHEHCLDSSRFEGYAEKKDSCSNVLPGKRIGKQSCEAISSGHETGETEDQKGLVLEKDAADGVNNEVSAKSVKGKTKNEHFSDDRPKKRGRKAKPSAEGLISNNDGLGIDEIEGISRLGKKGKKRIRKVEVSPTNRRSMVSLLVQQNIILSGSRVEYRSKKDGRAMAKGRIYSDGIECDCCQESFLLSKFEAHAGSVYHRPAANIFLEDGRSIFDCQNQLKQDFKGSKVIKGTQKQSTQDDICSVCYKDGYLVLCDSCPSAFHSNCIGLNGIPETENWFCPSCCCGICLQGQFSKLTMDRIECQQCEHQFHADCLSKNGVFANLNDGLWFCSEKCKSIYHGLRGISRKSISLSVDNLSWSLLKLNGFGKDVDEYNETRNKLHVAIEVIHECFEPIIHPWTNGDVVGDVIFSRPSKVKRVNFKGFFTAVLEMEDEMITVVTVRVHGRKMAEIPLVATRFRHRRRGMCRILMNEVERMLVEMGVETVVLPAVPEVVKTWTGNFGFSVMTEPERLGLLEYKILDFPGSIMCQKDLRKSQT